MQEKSTAADQRYEVERHDMVQRQLASRGINDRTVLEAFERVQRHLFVPDDEQDRAYDDHPLPIGLGQTISQPYVVAYMLQKLAPRPDGRVLEIGTGSGYQTALLAQLAREVYTVEVIPDLADGAHQTLARLGYENIEYRIGDGSRGWAAAAPFDGIVASASASCVHPQLTAQLAPGSRLILPVGTVRQHLIMVSRGLEQSEKTTLLPVRFVQMLEGP
jgi:protein-L-isoaspartate(D-aspartate) O-methyltransferase